MVKKHFRVTSHRPGKWFFHPRVVFPPSGVVLYLAFLVGQIHLPVAPGGKNINYIEYCSLVLLLYQVDEMGGVVFLMNHGRIGFKIYI